MEAEVAEAPAEPASEPTAEPTPGTAAGGGWVKRVDPDGCCVLRRRPRVVFVAFVAPCVASSLNSCMPQTARRGRRGVSWKHITAGVACSSSRSPRSDGDTRCPPTLRSIVVQIRPVAATTKRPDRPLGRHSEVRQEARVGSAQIVGRGALPDSLVLGSQEADSRLVRVVGVPPGGRVEERELDPLAHLVKLAMGTASRHSPRPEAGRHLGA